MPTIYLQNICKYQIKNKQTEIKLGENLLTNEISKLKLEISLNNNLNI
jgi:hypothetical protein